MTFKEYLLESSIMSHDALKQAGRDIDQRQLGKIDGSKPKEKRLSQMDKRRARKAGRAEEEEIKTTKRRNTPSTAEKAGYNDGRSGVKPRWNQSPAYNRGYDRGEQEGKRYHSEEEENTTFQADIDRYREFANRPEEKRAARPKPKRIQQKAKRDLRRVWGRGQSNPNAKSIGEM